MKIYVAGKTHDYKRVRRIQRALERMGHEITYDWTQAVEHHGVDHERVPPTPDDLAEYGELDRQAVLDAEMVVIVMHPHAYGTLIEFGLALSPVGSGTVRKHRAISVIAEAVRESPFHFLPGVEIWRDEFQFLTEDERLTRLL